MKSMDKISTGIAYGTSAGMLATGFYSGLIRSVRHSGLRWCTGESGSGLPDLSDKSVLQIREDKRKAARGE